MPTWVGYCSKDRIESDDPKDLLKDPLVMWQHRHVGKIALITNFLVCLIAGYFTGSYLGAFAIVGFWRLVVVLHIIFSINSFVTKLEHVLTIKSTARDSHMLALDTFGEAYHNFHHKFESDYRNGYNWYEWDPTKWIISIMSKFGWTHDLIRTPKNVVERIKLEAKNSIAPELKAVNQ
ncbi:MAG: hypothetical protein R2877_03260 [Bdellovibrionota bacterium]